MKQNLMFTAEKLGEPMNIAMPAKEAKGWFGTVPPDLSLVARARGADWVYTYLRSFYLDETRPLGVNNRVFPDVGMPHALWPIQGWQRPVYKTGHSADGQEEKVLERLELTQAGQLNTAEFDRAVSDLVNFLAYVAEPVRVERERLGIWVLLFLAVFTVLAYFLKKEYWKDIH
jgi:ubiquinol-cytochrome c reductase cytochrome c1 subunit